MFFLWIFSFGLQFKFFFFFHVSSRNFVTVLWTLFVVVAILIINFAAEVPNYIVMHFCLGNSIFRMTIVEVASTVCAPYSHERDWIHVGVCCQIQCISNSSSGLHYFLFFPDIISHREAMSFLFKFYSYKETHCPAIVVCLMPHVFVHTWLQPKFFLVPFDFPLPMTSTHPLGKLPSCPSYLFVLVRSCWTLNIF